ncbi:glycosyltransferase [Candidatus Thiodictyon syntrophicum]|nr:glycosyltransferase [Candidatus Thiodictyon syntrophicum]
MQLDQREIGEQTQATVQAAARPKALLVVSLWPDNNGTGTQRRAFQHLWCLSHAFDIDLIVAPRRPREPQAHDRLASLCRNVIELPVARDYILAVDRYQTPGFTLLGEMLRGRRRQWRPYRKKQRLQALESLARRLNGPYELQFFFRLDTAWLRTALAAFADSQTRYVIDLDDLDSSYMRQAAHVNASLLGRELVLAMHLRAQWLQRIEKRLLRRFDIATFASIADVARVARYRPTAQVSVLTNSVALLAQPLEPRVADGTYRLLFVGLMAYMPNADAAVFLAREIVPLIRSALGPRIELFLVGKEPPPAVTALDHPPQINVTGWVEDLLPYYRNADLIVMPIRMGSGTRIKAIEALNLGRPIVSTTLGVEGLGLIPGRHLLVADSAEDLAAACCRLLTDPALRAELVANGREKVRADLGYEQALVTLMKLLGRNSETLTNGC